MPITMQQANRALKQLPEDVKVEVQQVMDVTAYQVVTSASADVPLGPGRDGVHLRNSISWKRMERSTSSIVRVDQRAFWWKFLEYGTVKMAALGMFRRAGEKVRDGHHSRMVAALTRANSKMTK